MARRLGIIALLGFLAYTGIYIFVYLWRAFRLEGPNETVVRIWHGDDFLRTVLVSIFFLIGLTALGFIWTVRTVRVREGTLKIRRELLDWLEEEGTDTDEDPTVLAERAIAAYRARLEGRSLPDDG